MNSNVAYEPFKNDGVDTNVQVAMVPTAAGMGQQQQMAYVQQPSHVTTFVTDTPSDIPHWNWCNMITAICSICCCQVLGLIASFMATLAYVDHKVKDYSRSRHKRNVAWCLSITSIVLGSVAIVGMIIFVATVLNAKQRPVSQIINDINRNVDMNQMGGDNY